jgi:hypothetical protein
VRRAGFTAALFVCSFSALAFLALPVVAIFTHV